MRVLSGHISIIASFTALVDWGAHFNWCYFYRAMRDRISTVAIFTALVVSILQLERLYRDFSSRIPTGAVTFQLERFLCALSDHISTEAIFNTLVVATSELERLLRALSSHISIKEPFIVLVELTIQLRRFLPHL